MKNLLLILITLLSFSAMGQNETLVQTLDNGTIVISEWDKEEKSFSNFYLILESKERINGVATKVTFNEFNVVATIDGEIIYFGNEADTQGRFSKVVSGVGVASYPKRYFENMKLVGDHGTVARSSGNGFGTVGPGGGLTRICNNGGVGASECSAHPLPGCSVSCKDGYYACCNFSCKCIKE